MMAILHNITFYESYDWKPIQIYTKCTQISKRKDHLAEHIIMHTDEKPSKYRYCEKFCIKHCNLVIHAKTHTDGKPFRCNQCVKDVSQYSPR